MLSQKDERRLDYLRRSSCGFTGFLPLVCCPPPRREEMPPGSHINSAKIGVSDIIMQPKFTRTVSQSPDENYTQQSIVDVTKHPNLRLLPLDICGVATSDRIINGNKANLQEYTWMALLQYEIRGKGKSFLCGGTVINKNHILTAAHCVTNLQKNIKLVGVRVGEYNLDTEIDCEEYEGAHICNAPAEDFSIEEVIAHPLFASSSDNPKSTNKLQNDIALVRIKGQINFKNVQPICLPVSTSDQQTDLQFLKATVAGWGVTENGTRSSELMKVNVPLIQNAKCSTLYKNSSPPIYISKKQICAGGSGGFDSCSGDSGGPLMQVGEVLNDARIVQYGIVSFGPLPCGMNGYPAVHTNVASFIQWILSNLKA